VIAQEHNTTRCCAVSRASSLPRDRCAHVEGCDIDPVVPTHPFLDQAVVIEPGKPLPFPDNNFDIAFGEDTVVFVSYVSSEPGYQFRKLLVYRGGQAARRTPAQLTAAGESGVHPQVLARWSIVPEKRSVRDFTLPGARRRKAANCVGPHRVHGFEPAMSPA
jgi:hypothetical protein